MEICKVSTPRFSKALKKHNITHIMYIDIEMENAIRKLTKANT